MFKKRQKLAWEQRLDAEILKLQQSASYRELTLNRLKDLVSPPSELALVRALAENVSDGRLRVRYRVVSPETKASIATFESPVDVPETIFDDSTGEEFQVDPFRNVESVYLSGEARSTTGAHSVH